MPDVALDTELKTIQRLGRRGEGIAEGPDGRLYIPYALPGDRVEIERRGGRGTVRRLIAPSSQRIEPLCPFFGTCGGCAVQALAAPAYAAWKRGLLLDALVRAGVAAEVAPLVDAHGAGRRRATFHARTAADGTSDVGFMRARAHDIVAIDACPILDPRLAGALPAARAIGRTLAAAGKPLDIVAAATDTGLDIDLRGRGPLSDDERKRLVAVALDHGLARLSNHGIVVAERAKPIDRVGRAQVAPPPGAFRQATAVGETALADRVVAALAGARRVGDLFAGLGTFALRLAETSEVAAYDTEAAPLAALDAAARATPGLRPVRTEVRDLVRRPLDAGEVSALDALVLDPPRAGAEAQMRAVAAGTIERVVSVACDVDSFARDAAILVAAGFTPERIEPIDQFRYSAHVEIFATFRRRPTRPKRRLLG